MWRRIRSGYLFIISRRTVSSMEHEVQQELIVDHFHVHVVHIEHEGLAGMNVGQAHLLDDLISLVSLAFTRLGPP